MMPRHVDHLVLCVHDLDAAAQRFRSLGFTLVPPADLPWGNRNRLALLEDNFIELLAISDPGAISPHSDRDFSFGAHTQGFLAGGEGMSMLAFKSTDAHADAAGFAARGVSTFKPYDFSRNAVLPDGRTLRVAFSLAFATDPGLPRLAFFCCQHRQATREVLWKPEYQRHANSARRVVEVVLAVDEPAAHRRFLERLTEEDASVAPAGRSLRFPRSSLTILGWDELANRFPECGVNRGSPCFAAYGVAVNDIGALERHLQASGAAYRRSGTGSLIVAPSAAFGTAIEFTGVEGGA